MDIPRPPDWTLCHELASEGTGRDSDKHCPPVANMISWLLLGRFLPESVCRPNLQFGHCRNEQQSLDVPALNVKLARIRAT